MPEDLSPNLEAHTNPPCPSTPQNPPGRQVNPRLTCTREGPRRSGLTRYFDEARFKMGLAGGREESRGEGGRRPRPAPPGPRMGSTVIIPALALPDRPHHGPSLEMLTGSPSAQGGEPSLHRNGICHTNCLCDELDPRPPVDLSFFFFCHANGRTIVGKTSFAECAKRSNLAVAVRPQCRPLTLSQFPNAIQLLSFIFISLARNRPHSTGCLVPKFHPTSSIVKYNSIPLALRQDHAGGNNHTRGQTTPGATATPGATTRQASELTPAHARRREESHTARRLLTGLCHLGGESQPRGPLPDR